MSLSSDCVWKKIKSTIINFSIFGNPMILRNQLYLYYSNMYDFMVHIIYLHAMKTRSTLSTIFEQYSNMYEFLVTSRWAYIFAEIKDWQNTIIYHHPEVSEAESTSGFISNSKDMRNNKLIISRNQEKEAYFWDIILQFHMGFDWL